MARFRSSRSRGKPRLPGPSFNQVIPNLLTMIGLCVGLTAMRFALEDRFGDAAVAITVAAAIDGIDGRLARFLKGTSRFGAEFDSLSDFLCFGVAPAFTLYLWSLVTVGSYGYLPCVMFAVCMALRLARFNASLDSAVRPVYAYNFFTGVPAPAGAGIALFPLFAGLYAQSIHSSSLLWLVQHPIFCTVVLIGTSSLLVSTLPVWSFKNFKIPRPIVLPILLGTGLFVVLLITDPWAALAIGGLLYVGMLPFSVRSFRRLQREARILEDRRNISEIVSPRSHPTSSYSPSQRHNLGS